MEQARTFNERFVQPHIFTLNGFQLELSQQPPSLSGEALAPPSITTTKISTTTKTTTDLDPLGTGTTVWRGGSLLASLFGSSLNHLIMGKAVLDVGSGTGIAGLAAGACGASLVLLTDLPSMLPLLRQNATRNSFVSSLLGCSVAVEPLGWGQTGDGSVSHLLRTTNDIHSGLVVIGADVCYHERHPEPLARTLIEALVECGAERAVVSCERHEPVAFATLKCLLLEGGLEIEELFKSDDSRVVVLDITKGDEKDDADEVEADAEAVDNAKAGAEVEAEAKVKADNSNPSLQTPEIKTSKRKLKSNDTQDDFLASKKKIASADDSTTCCECGEKTNPNPMNVCQFCDQPACDKCIGKWEGSGWENGCPFLRCQCGLVGPGLVGPSYPKNCHECDGGSEYSDWTNWCADCGCWHCFSCSEIGCCDSDEGEESDQHLQASFRNCGGRDVVMRELNGGHTEYCTEKKFEEYLRDEREGRDVCGDG